MCLWSGRGQLSRWKQRTRVRICDARHPDLKCSCSSLMICSRQGESCHPPPPTPRGLFSPTPSSPLGETSPFPFSRAAAPSSREAQRLGCGGQGRWLGLGFLESSCATAAHPHARGQGILFGRLSPREGPGGRAEAHTPMAAPQGGSKRPPPPAPAAELTGEASA